MKQYKEYLYINLPWLESIPSHWEVVRNKVLLKESIATVGVEFLKYPLLSLTKGGVVLRDVSSGKGKFPNEFNSYKIVERGQIIFCLFDIDETPRTIGLSRVSGMITGAYDVFSISGINPNYLEYYYLSLDNVKAMSPLYTGLRKVIGKTTFLQIKLPLPPRNEQDQIVHFLDWKVSQINKLISVKRKQIVLLQEQKQALINHEVTKCGTGWCNYRMKNLFIERNERSANGTEIHLSMSQKYGLISDKQLDERRMLSESYAGGKICHENDIVLNRLKAHLGVFALARQSGVISPDYTVLQPIISKITPQYAEYYLKSNICRNELRTRVRGVVEGFWRLYTEDFNMIEMSLPSISEQNSIVAYLNKQCESIDRLISKFSYEISLFSEYRIRLISDVVTGKLDVRGIMVPEYETIEDMDDESIIESDIFED